MSDPLWAVHTMRMEDQERTLHIVEAPTKGAAYWTVMDAVDFPAILAEHIEQL